MKKLFIIIIIGFYSIILFGQNDKLSATIVFYNVENLFDTINDPNTADESFTPEGRNNWTNKRYTKKLNDIASVISSVNTEELPALAGFCEVENRKVLEDLTKTTVLKSKNYKIVHEESPDARGIDVGLIYCPDEFTYLLHKKIPVNTGTEYKVRDILYTKGILYETDTIHIFVNHWKSRSGGVEKTEPQRIKCAQTLRKEVDSILSVNKNVKILIMGDLNDEPKNKSVFETLGANNSNKPESLYNLMLPLSENGEGTHCYRGEWSMLDHLIVSNNLLNNNSGFILDDKRGQIFRADWITYESKEGYKSPGRTYGGPNYYGGYSDHYPVFVTLIKH
ncbi:MAG: endonuclease [Bacteroidales bacterium]|nr:endonuclease [Bacteroidales bacterium]